MRGHWGVRKVGKSVLLLTFVMAVGLLWMGVTAARADGPVTAAATEPAWRAVYWNNTTLSGQPAFFRDETELDHNWGLGSPDPAVNADNFSARWTRIVDVPAGRYRFSVTGDDGVRVFVNDELVLNGWWDHGVRTFTTERDLAAGQHEIRVEFYEHWGAAVVKFSLETVSTQPGPTPSATPTPTPTPPPEGYPPQPGPEEAAWTGAYFANEFLDDPATFVRQDAKIDFNWGAGSPGAGIPEDFFSVRWERKVYFSGGLWRFTTTTDDGVRLYIDGHLVLDKWQLQAATSHSVKVNLQEGVHVIRMEYFEHGGQAVAKLTWEPGAVLSGVGNLITCAPPNPPNYAWIKVYRKDPSTGEWYRAIPRGVGSIHPSGYIKIDGLPVNLAVYGPQGEPYWIERWIDGKLADSIGNTDRGEPEFRIRPNADNYTPWSCPR